MGVSSIVLMLSKMSTALDEVQDIQSQCDSPIAQLEQWYEMHKSLVLYIYIYIMYGPIPTTYIHYLDCYALLALYMVSIYRDHT